MTHLPGTRVVVTVGEPPLTQGNWVAAVMTGHTGTLLSKCDWHDGTYWVRLDEEHERAYTRQGGWGLEDIADATDGTSRRFMAVPAHGLALLDATADHDDNRAVV